MDLVEQTKCTRCWLTISLRRKRLRLPISYITLLCRRRETPAWRRYTRLIIIPACGMTARQVCTRVRLRTALFSRTYWKCKEFKSTDKARSYREICGSFLFAEVLVWHTDIASGKFLSIRAKKYSRTLCRTSLPRKKKQQSGCLHMSVDAGRSRFIFTKK